jgi:Cu/Ag efflux protein CusF
MASMVMSYQVTPVTLLENIQAGDKVHFTIDPATRVITKIAPLSE